jgi:hypothetical protein
VLETKIYHQSFKKPEWFQLKIFSSTGRGIRFYKTNPISIFVLLVVLLSERGVGFAYGVEFAVTGETGLVLFGVKFLTNLPVGLEAAKFGNGISQDAMGEVARFVVIFSAVAEAPGGVDDFVYEGVFERALGGELLAEGLGELGEWVHAIPLGSGWDFGLTVHHGRSVHGWKIG